MNLRHDIPSAALSRVDHRPWPLPAGRWILRQRWLDLLFAHWPVPASRLRALVPSALAIQEFAGTSWVGIVPFSIVGLSGRGMPDVPGISAFPELNLRLYVEADGKPGVWFISLDAGSRAAVAAAWTAFRLPYFHARMTAETLAGITRVKSSRARNRAIGCEVDYAPAGPPHESRPGTLEHFLTERYCLYTRWHDHSIRRMQIQHPPWLLQKADGQFLRNTLAELQGVQIDSGVKPLLHFSARQDVLAWMPERLGQHALPMKG